MNEAVSYTLTYIALPSVFGIASFFFLNFIGRDFVTFFDLRREVVHAIAYTANISKMIDGEVRFHQSADALRSLGTRMSALHHTSNTAVRTALKLFGFDPLAASLGLIGFSNTLGGLDSERLLHRYQIEEGLKLDHPTSRETIEAMVLRDERRKF